MNQPQPAKIHRLDENFRSVAELEVQFNPSEFTLNKGIQIAEIPIPGLDQPLLQFVRGQTETLTVDLFFDTTDGGMSGDVQPVTARTDKFYQLIKIDPQTHAPPICWFAWGGAHFPGSHFESPWASQNREGGMRCIVESVRQRFTVFSPGGVPLRATLTVTLREYYTVRQQVQRIGLRSADHTQARVVQRGDTISSIAAQMYHDPSRWREIAAHNNIDDPLALRPGVILQVPPLR
jgi:hypothetical protein